MYKKEKRGILGLGILPIENRTSLAEENIRNEFEVNPHNDWKTENEGNLEQNEMKDNEVPSKEEEPTEEIEEDKPKPPEAKVITNETEFKTNMANMGWTYKEYTPETAPDHLGLKEKGMFEGYDKIFITEVDTLDIITVLNLSRTNFSYISSYVLGYKA